MMIGTLIIARDFSQAPEELASVHVNDKVKWPPLISISAWVFGVGLVAAGGLVGGLAARARALGKIPAPETGSRGPIRRAADDVYLFGGRFGLQLSIASTIVFAFYLAQGLVPRLSTHLSFKPVLESYTKFAHEGEKIGKYRIEGHGSTFYSKQNMVDLPSQDRVVQFLRDPQRVFAMVPTDELAALDAAFKQARVPYFVVDASSSRFLLITNQLGVGTARRQSAVQQRVDAAGRRSERAAALAVAREHVRDVRRRRGAGGRGLPEPAFAGPARSRWTSTST